LFLLGKRERCLPWHLPDVSIAVRRYLHPPTDHGGFSDSWRLQFSSQAAWS
jgi:hypothetical protein